MGLFAKNKTDTQRMLFTSSKSKSVISSLQLKLSKSSSSSYDDDDGGKQKKIIASDDDGMRKKKFWRVLPEVMVANTPTDPYIPPSGILPLQHAPIDPFASTSSVMPKNDNTMILDAVNHTDHSSHIIRTAKSSKQGTFQRLDSMDDASYENIHQTVDLSKKKQPFASAAIGTIHLPLKSSSLGKKHKNRLSKHMVAQKSKGSFTKLNNNSTPTSSIGDVSTYQPPTFEISQPETKNAPIAKNGFLLDVIRYSSSGEEVFDVRSESTNRSSTQNSGSHATPIDTSGIIHRCHSIGTESDVYSESMRSELYSDSGFPEPPAKPAPHTFQQILFDESFRKITAVSKSDAGSNTATYSDLAKAATQLTMVLSPEPKFYSIGTVAPSQPSVSKEATINGYRKMTESSSTSQEDMERSKNLFSHDSVAPTSLPSRKNTKINKPMTMNIVSNKSNWKRIPESEDDCDGRSITSNQSSQKSRREYQEAIRSKIRSPTKKKAYSKNGQLSATTAGMNQGTVPFSSPISTANATFSNSVRSSNKHRDDTVLQMSKRIHTSNDSADPFLLASDFNITQFPTDEKDDDDDPFQIGVEIVESEDSAWNVHAHPFQNFGSSSCNQSKDGTATSHPHRVYGETVAKATSMDDGLIESIRKASLRQSKKQRGIDPDDEENYKYGNKDYNESHGNPSNQMVRPSQSDSAMEYVHPNGYHNHTSERQPQLKKKNVTKGVPANAILGSMLFRQTETSFTDEHSDKKRKGNDIPTKQHRPTKSPRSAGGVDDDRYDHNGMRVPRSVHADRAAKSDVSSVTEEASAFYVKNLLHLSSKWNESAQNILNQYNVQKKTLHARDTNAYAHPS
jgi:hypothetical protein